MFLFGAGVWPCTDLGDPITDTNVVELAVYLTKQREASHGVPLVLTYRGRQQFHERTGALQRVFRFDDVVAHEQDISQHLQCGGEVAQRNENLRLPPAGERKG